MKTKLLFALAVVVAVFVGCKKNNAGGESSPAKPEETINRLDKDGPANCYIVSKPGTYHFLPVKGNSNEPVGEIMSTIILWASFGTSETPGVGDVISNCYLDSSVGDKPLIAFNAPSPLKNGNAVIAALGYGLEVLWSWHIWVCADYDPDATAQVYYGNAGTVMDRNLGATSATPGDVGALGLMYQWGRKDPFLGGDGIKSSKRAASTATWPEPEAGAAGKNDQYARQNPMVFITKETDSYGDWNSDGSSISLLWAKSKSINDPCPHGWKVPEGYTDGLWQTAMSTLSTPPAYKLDEDNCGVNFSGVFGDSDTIWYPTAGYLNYTSGVLNDVGYSSYTWSVTNSDHMSFFFGFDISGGKVTSPVKDADHRAYGQSVRCVKEI